MLNQGLLAMASDFLAVASESGLTREAKHDHSRGERWTSSFARRDMQLARASDEYRLGQKCSFHEISPIHMVLSLALTRDNILWII